MSHHTKFTDEEKVSDENDLDLPHEHQFHYPGFFLELDKTTQNSRSTIRTTAPPSPLQSSTASDSPSGSSASREWHGNSRMEPVAGPSYVKSGIDTQSKNRSHLPTKEHGYQNTLNVTRNRSEGLPIAEIPRYSFTSREDQHQSHVEPVEEPAYGHVSGNTLTQGPSYVQYGTGKACADVQYSVPATVSMNPENFESEKSFYDKELEIPDSIRRRHTDDDSTMQNAADPFRMLHIQKSHLGDRKRAEVNAESYDHNTASYASTDASKLTYQDENSRERHFHGLPKNPSSRECGVTSKINTSTSRTLSMGETNYSCVTSVTNIKDSVPQINPKSTEWFSEVNYSTSHTASELSENSVSDTATSRAIIREMQNPHDAQSQQMYYDPRTLPYQLTSKESRSLFTVQKNESGGLPMPRLNKTQTLAENGNIILHKSIHGTEKAFVCDVCENEFNRKDQLENHKKIHTAKEPFKCAVCEKEFSFKKDLTIHKRFHTGEKPFICDICEKGFHTNGNLKRHYTTHSAEKHLKCDACNKSFARTDHLRQHGLIHDNGKPFICDICKKGFDTREKLTRHSKSHSVEKSFKCDVCNKFFDQMFKLTKHKRIHGEEKPFICDICEKGFHTNGNLTRHYTTHSGKKPFKCDVCNKSFARADHLRQHGLVHDKEKPFI